MSTLILFLPPRDRLRAQGQATPAAPADSPGRTESAGGEYDYVLSGNGRQVTAEGRAVLHALPPADQIVLVPADADLAWHRVHLPKVNRARLPAALAGLMEDELLDDPDNLHFALEPQANGGEEAWVAVCPRAWLNEYLAALDAAHLFVDRIAPLSWPGSPRGHFQQLADEGRFELLWADVDGVSSLSLAGTFGRVRFNPERVQGAVWSATADAVAAAEHWLGSPVPVQSRAQRALQALESSWNLRQFELAPRTRGLRAVRQLYRGLMHKSWAPVRWGVAGLVAVQVLGLNLWAWQQNRQLEQLRSSVTGVLKSTHPQVRAVLDAPLQMQRETETLRAQAGRAGAQDLESLLSAAATAWPADRGPADALTFETGKLTLSAQGWTEAQLSNFRQQLQSEGWQLEVGDGRMTLRRAKQNERPRP